MDEIIDTATAAILRTLPATPTGWLASAATCFALAALAAVLWTKVRRKWLARASRTLGGRFSGFMSAYYLRLFLPIAALAITWAFLAYLWKLPALIGGVLDLLDTSLDAARDGAPTASDDIRSLAYAFAALAGALTIFATIPFQLVKVWTNERQTRTAEENLTTDLINKAVEGLGAQKEVNRLGRSYVYASAAPIADEGTILKQGFQWHDEPDPHPSDAKTDVQPVGDAGEPWKNVTLTVPNIEVRLGAIYALERIAQDSPRDHIRVMEILCAYLRENAPARDAQPNPLGPWPDYPETPTEDDLRARDKTLKYRRAALDPWISDLRRHHAPRADIQAAVTVIGRRSPAQIALEQAPRGGGTPAYRLDLHKVTLQAANLWKLDLRNAQLDGAHLEGASLGSAHLQNAGLYGAHLEGANLDGAHLQGTNLPLAHLEGAHLGGAHLEGANLFGAHLAGARLGGAHLTDKTFFKPAALHGAGLKDVNVAIALKEDEFFASLRSKKISIVENEELPRLLSEAFGDASVTLPDGLKAGEPPLKHWSTDTLDPLDFEIAWLNHQRDIGYAPPD